MKKNLLAAMMLSLSMGSAYAQKIDFNLSGKESTSTADGYTSWAIGREKSSSKTIDGLSITVTSVAGTEANAVMNNWWKDGVSKYDKLISDGVYATYLDANNDYKFSADKPMGLQFTIKGLTAGEHSICAFHNNTDGLTNPYPTVKVLVNDKELATGVEQTIRQQKQGSSGMSYVKFNVTEGETIVVKYISEPKEGVTYSNTTVAVNALVFDRPNPQTAAADPTPVHQDFHYDCDNGKVTLSWVGGSSAVRHHVLIGTVGSEMKEVAKITATKYTLDANTAPWSELLASPRGGADGAFLWRIDEEDAKGNVYEGDVWAFRPRHLAFPGAEGYGRFAIGGRGGVVYHVTSLDDDVNNPQPGTFRYGIKNVSGPRTIVFDVSGYITLKGRLTCSDPYVTIAGQTAPGKGIIFRGSPVGFASDGIVRFIRNHRGYAATTAEQDNGLDGFGMAGCDNSIMDHCSIAWTIDEAFSSRNAKSITLQRTLISEALNCADHPNYGPGTCHGYAATIGGGQGGGVGSFHHNLLAHNEGRNWSLSGGLTGGGEYDGAHDVFNNVVYNWGGRATDGGSHEINFVNNYYKKGPATTQNYLLRLQLEGTGKGTQSAYVSGNIREELTGTKTKDALNNTYQYQLSGGQQLSWTPFVSEPFFPSYANVETAEAAYINVLSDVGCNQPVMDDHDVRMVTETYKRSTSTVGSKTGKKGLIDRESDAGGYEEFETVARGEGFDSDQDGMPDWWEKLHDGLDANVADNNTDADGDGYTALEEYLNWLAEPHFDVNSGAKKDINLQNYFAGYPSSVTYTVECDATGYTASVADGVLSVTVPETVGIASVAVTATAGEVSLTRQFNIRVDDFATGIVSVTDDKGTATMAGALYNLGGQKVSKDYKGIVVKNGRKVVNM